MNLLKKGDGFFIFFIILLFIPLFSRAESSDYFTLSQKKIYVEMTNKIYSTTNNLKVNLSFFPLNDERQFSEIEIFPKENSFLYQQGLIFNFNERGDINFGLRANVTTTFLIKKLKEINFSDLENLNDKEITIYKKASKYADSDNILIRNKALQLIKKNSSIETLFNIANYVKNSLTYDAETRELKKASKILQEKKGVCSHYTILFISLVRAVGFPARYVSGITYSEKIKDFEDHAWAEVYLPNQGWVPFDITFGQFGWLDDNHIAFKKSIDAGEASVTYKYVGGYIQPEPLEIKAIFLEDKVKKIASNVTLEAKLYKEKVSMNSYVPLFIKVINNNSFYLIIPIRVWTAPAIYGESQKILLIEPFSEKNIGFLVYIPYEERCKKGCFSEIEIKDIFNKSYNTKIFFSNFYENIPLEVAQKIINESKYEDIDFYCILNSENDRKKNISCYVGSITNSKKNLSLCYYNSCQEFFLEKEKRIDLEIETLEKEICFLLKDTSNFLESCLVFKEKETFFKVFFKKILLLFRKL